MTLEEARRPAVVEAGGVRVGVLSYNCVGPRESRATSRKAGAAALDVLTHYELDYAGPGGPPRVYTFVAPESLDVLRADVLALRATVDVAVVAFHKGIGHVPVVVPAYERELGADGDRLRRRRRRRPPRAHPPRHRGVSRQAGLPRPRQLRRRHARADAGRGERRRARGVGEAAARALRLRARPGDAVLPLPPGEPEHDRRRLPGRPDGAVDAGFVPCWIDDRGPARSPRERRRGGRGLRRADQRRGGLRHGVHAGTASACAVQAGTQASGSVSGP